MKFPILELTETELEMHKVVGSNLVARLNYFFLTEYGITPQIKVTGSTDKGTALPERFFGIDFDSSVSADDKLIDKIAYKSEEFEGCQLFSMDFFSRFSRHFPQVYFAGHRISGFIDGRKFDFSITDQDKDKWKWDYNNSKYLRFTPEQVNAAKKIKYFLKELNAYGSEAYGIVGPAIELLTYHHETFSEIITRMRSLVPIDSSLSDSFKTVIFPGEFYALFPESEDYIHEGLMRSFRYTMPNTYNRIIKALSLKNPSSDEFIQTHNPGFTYSKELPTDNERMIAYFFANALKNYDGIQIELLRKNGKIVVYSKGNQEQTENLDKACENISRLSSGLEFRINQLPDYMQEDIEKKAGNLDLDKYSFFIGQPKQPLVKGFVYVPFDFLVREDAYKLIKVMEAGQSAVK